MDALNQQEEHNVKNIFKDDDSFLQSDVDEQLIISVPFNQRKWDVRSSTMWVCKTDECPAILAVKLHSLKFKVPNIGK